MSHADRAPDAPVTPAPRRSTFLTTLCLLSFLGGPLSIAASVLALWFVTKLSAPDNSHLLLGFTIGCTFVGLWGVALMWKGSRRGFYVYAVASTLGVAAPILSRALIPGIDTIGRLTVSSPLLGRMETPWAGLIITVAFILMYAANVRAMRGPGGWPVVTLAGTLLAAAALAIVLVRKDTGSITGVVRLVGTKNEKLFVGYSAETTDGRHLSFVGGLSDASKLQTQMLSANDREGRIVRDASGLKVEYTRLPAGRYLLWVRYGEAYLDWRVLDFKGGRMESMLAVDLDQAGSIALQSPGGAEGFFIELAPVTPERVVERARLLHFVVEGPTPTVSNVKPGAYNLSWSAARKEDGSWRWGETRSIDVTVSAGAVSRVPIPVGAGAASQ
jgi:hypothetical protein